MKELFNDGWSFSKLLIENKTDENSKPILFVPDDFLGKESEPYKSVNLPHDYLISDAKNLYQNSVGFYKKDFDLKKMPGKRFYIRFGAVYMNWALYVNGKKAGEWKYGYSTVEFDITDFLCQGKNSLQVICVYQSPNTRWYSGAGIFRDVFFITKNDTRIVNDGIYFSTEKNSFDDCNKNEWKLFVQTEVESHKADGLKNLTVVNSIFDSDGNEIELTETDCQTEETEPYAPEMGISFNKNKILLVKKHYTVKDVKIWSLENPNVYILKTKIFSGQELVDEEEKNVGFKTVVFDKDKGCFVNGQHVKLHGVCEHHDFGLFGAAFNLPSLKRKFLMLKEMGVNSLRTSHNPPDEKLMDLADKMGILVIDECFDMWEKPKTTYDYGNYFIDWHRKDCAAYVRRDRNHPCLIMWSIGNEIYDTHEGNGYEITKDLRSVCRIHDPLKNGKVTIGSNYMEWEGGQHCAEEIDLVGYNYGERLYEDHHKRHPDWCIYGSETSSTVQSRGIYHFPLSNRLLTYQDSQCSCLGNCSTNWGAKSSSVVVTKDRDAEYCAGQYLWTGFDYIGEPTPYSTKNSFFGQIDTAGFKKDTFYVYKAGWVPFEKEAFVHILPYWDFNEGQLIDIRIYSNAPQVELFVNGKSLGKKNMNPLKDEELSATWEGISYSKGKIEAIAYDCGGKEICRDAKESFGDPASILLSLEEKYCEDGFYFVDISTLDENGIDVANSRSRIFLSVEGAELLGADNGDSTDYEQYQSADKKTLSRKLFSNRLLAVVKSSDGNFKIKASSGGLKEAVLVLKNGRLDKEASLKESGKVSSLPMQEIPLRKIELTCEGQRKLRAENKCVTVKANVFPQAAKNYKLDWSAMMLEGVKSDSAKIEVSDDGLTAKVTGVSDGNFRLTCTCSNGSKYAEIISELEFEVTGLGKASRSPYQLIEACKCSSSSKPVELSFDGGAFTHNEKTSFTFDRVDFGSDGADTFEVPIFSFDTELKFEIWDGDCQSGKKLADCSYSHPSIYNTYNSNIHLLPRRLFGLHTITFVFLTGLSFQGFKFHKEAKAFAKLNALDASLIFGDAFTKAESSVNGIGNNVVLDFDAMDFADSPASKITIKGRPYVHNTIHVKFSGENGDFNDIIEFDAADDIVEKTFDIHGAKGKNKVSFVFLPGSNFDFYDFQFKK